MLVNMNDVLRPAKKGHYAVGLFNAVNLELARGIIAAAESTRSPVIMGTAEVLLPYGPLDEVSYYLIPMAKKASVTVVVHLDHGLSYDLCIKALDLGFTSIMYDCSTDSYEENVRKVKEMADIAHSRGATIEGELGHVGDNEGSAEGSSHLADPSAYFTDPKMAKDFVEKTGVDALAIAVGNAPGVPDHISLWGLLLAIRKGFDQYINLRPVKLLRGAPTPIKNATEENVDMIFVRENSEGEYAGSGAWLFKGQPNEVVIQNGVFSRKGCERVIRYAYELAKKEGKTLTSISKANALNYSMVFWDEVFEEIGKEYPEVKTYSYLVDAASMFMVKDPARFEIVVTSNLFGDILTDLGAAIAGGMGLAAGANLNPEREFPSMFEPIHGSAPDIAGKGIANPLATAWSASQMLDFFGHEDLGARVIECIEEMLVEKKVLTPDLGGSASTSEVGDALVEKLLKLKKGEKKMNENAKLKAFKMHENLYFIGSEAVSVHLLDTEDGLVLIDSGYPSMYELIISNIRALGFFPENITAIFHSHGHIDHYGTTRELVALSGAKTYISRIDNEIVNGTLDLSWAKEIGIDRVEPFDCDVLIEDGDVFSFGKTSIRCVHTPGHTAGVMSFVVTLPDGTHAAMHGGIGTNTLRSAFLLEYGLSFDCRDWLKASCRKLMGERVELVLGNHPQQSETVEKMVRLENGESILDGEEWGKFLNAVIEMVDGVEAADPRPN